MTEYRIVATLDTHHIYNGKRFHYDAAAPWIYGRPWHKVYSNLKDAEEMLDEALKVLPEFDAKTQAKTDRSAIHYWHSNIRIQKREVTPWED